MNMTESHRAIESCNCEACLDAKALARMLQKEQATVRIMDTNLKRVEAERDTLKAALLGVKSTSRKGPCWCDYSHNVKDEGHQAKCRAALAACVPPQETEP